MAEPRTEKTIHVFPGDVQVGRGGVVLRTVLGSCVAVCLWDAAAEVGGMNHFLLPKTPDDLLHPGRYGDKATHRLVKLMIRKGARAERLRAKVFGGAGLLHSGQPRAGQLGAGNYRMAFAVLEALGIPVVEHDVGGRSGRRVEFRLADGTTWMRRL